MGEIQTIPKMVGLRHWVYHISYFAVSCFKSLKITAVESTSRFCGRQKVMPLFVDTVWQRPMNPILKEWRKKTFLANCIWFKVIKPPSVDGFILKITSHFWLTGMPWPKGQERSSEKPTRTVCQGMEFHWLFNREPSSSQQAQLACFTAPPSPKMRVGASIIIISWLVVSIIL